MSLVCYEWHSCEAESLVEQCTWHDPDNTMGICFCVHNITRLALVPVFLRWMRYCRSSNVDASAALTHMTLSTPCSTADTCFACTFEVHSFLRAAGSAVGWARMHGMHREGGCRAGPCTPACKLGNSAMQDDNGAMCCQGRLVPQPGLAHTFSAMLLTWRPRKKSSSRPLACASASSFSNSSPANMIAGYNESGTKSDGEQ